MKNKNISTFIGFDNEYHESKIVVFGAPFDGTTSFRPGTRFAPEVMRRESYGLETYSPYLEKDLENYNVFDGGDLEFSFGNPMSTLESIYKYAQKILKDDKVPFMVGGEHLVSYGTIKAVHEKYPDLHVIHLDAHADLRDDYMGEKFSHASVIRRCWDFLGDGKIYQFGIRSGNKEEFSWAKDHTYMEKFGIDTLAEIIEKLKDVPVYITIDLDILDPSIFSGTGTPEPGGLTFTEIIKGIKEFEKLNIVGGDIVELSPNYDASGASTATACKVLREVILTMV